MALIVQKYGGTSVGTIERIKNVAKRALSDHEKGNQVVVVVSAMAGETDRLVALAKEISPVPPTREYDVLLSTGEQVTTALLSMGIQELGHKATSFQGHQIQITTTEIFSRAKIKSVDINKVKKALETDQVVIVAGFQGVNPNGDITTLGRGGSDITAVALATALKADRVEYYKDVDGIFTANPTICPNAKKIDKISFEEMLELSHLGAKVLHPRSVELARQNSIPLIVRSSLNHNPGSQVVPEEEIMEHAIVSGIVVDSNQAKFALMNIPDVPGILASIFTKIAEEDINIDMIVQNASDGSKLTELSFTCSTQDIEPTKTVIEKLIQEFPGADYCINDNLSKLSIVGAGMKTHSGVASKMFSILAQEGINIFMVNTSEIKVSCLIEEKHSELAVRILHDRFQLGN
jgi:aspartate kinase